MHRERVRTPVLVAGLLSAGILIGFMARSGPRPAEVAAQEAGRKDTAKDTAKAESNAAGDESAVRKSTADYVAAMNKGELGAVMAFWAPDAEYIDESGNITRGREAITAMFREALPDLKKHKISAREHSVRTLRPDVVLQDGSLEFCGPDGCKEFNRYAVVWTKTDGKWLISSARDLPSDVTEVPSLAYPQLQALEWLVGEWSADSPKSDVKLTCKWGPNKSFLLMDYEVRRDRDEPLTVTQRIGWDPVNQTVRSWVFDSDGGFGEGDWQKDGVKWVVDSSGVLPDGGIGTATHVWEFVDPQTFAWRATDREVDGQPLGNMEVKFVRKNQKEGGRP